MSCILEFKENALYRINENTRMIEIAITKATAYCALESNQALSLDSLLWQRPNNSSNSLGNQILHLCGNIKQYVISSLGGQQDLRDRDMEFNTKERFTAAILLAKLKETVTITSVRIQNATSAQLLKKRVVQGFTLSGMGCALHAVEHYSYHTGQIAFWIKQLIDQPLGFYDGMNLNTLNI